MGGSNGTVSDISRGVAAQNAVKSSIGNKSNLVMAGSNIIAERPNLLKK